MAGFIGALSANMKVIWPFGIFSNPLVASIVCLLIGAAIGGHKATGSPYHDTELIVTLAGMLIFRQGLCQAMLDGGASVGPLPMDFKALSSGFLADFTGSLSIIPPTLNAAGKPLYGTGFSLNILTLIVGVISVIAYVAYGLRERRTREEHGYAVEPVTLFSIKTLIISLLTLFLFFQFASYKGLPLVLLLMAVLIALFIFVTNRTTIGRRVYAMGGNSKAAQLSGIKTDRLTLLVFVNMGVLSALGGLIIAARLGQAVPAAGLGSELDVIAAVFIGGASAMGGVGQVAGAVIGAFIMGVMNNGMSILGVNVDYQQVVKGLVLLGAVVFDVYNKNKG